MKIPIALAVATAVLSASAGAAECEYNKFELDPFTKEKLVTTKWNPLTGWLKGIFNQTIGNNTEISVRGIVEGEQQYLAMQLKLSDTTGRGLEQKDIRNGFEILQGMPLTVFMADESAVELYADQGVKGDTRLNIDKGTYIIKTTATVRYVLDAIAVEALSVQEATQVRVAAARNNRFDFVDDSGHANFAITEKARGNIRQAVVCIQQDSNKDTS